MCTIYLCAVHGHNIDSVVGNYRGSISTIPSLQPLFAHVVSIYILAALSVLYFLCTPGIIALSGGERGWGVEWEEKERERGRGALLLCFHAVERQVCHCLVGLALHTIN